MLLWWGRWKLEMHQACKSQIRYIVEAGWLTLKVLAEYVQYFNVSQGTVVRIYSAGHYVYIDMKPSESEKVKDYTEF